MVSLKCPTVILLLCFSVQVNSELSYGGDYSYDDSKSNGPSKWFKINPQCKGKNQSPINIDDKYSGQKAFSISLGNFHLKPKVIVMENDGQTAEMKFHYANKQKATITGNIVNNGVYIVDSVHFHWGENDTVGSEHYLKGHRYAGEMHIVAYNRKYKSLQAANKVKDGIAIIASFLKIDHRHKKFPISLNPYFSYLSKISEPKSKISITGKGVVSLYDMLKEYLITYYAYRGSLTTPDCEESVIWIINRLPVYVTSEEMNKFRRLKNKKGQKILRNYRPLQRLNKRPVFKKH